MLNVSEGLFEAVKHLRDFHVCLSTARVPQFSEKKRNEFRQLEGGRCEIAIANISMRKSFVDVTLRLCETYKSVVGGNLMIF